MHLSLNCKRLDWGVLGLSQTAGDETPMHSQCWWRRQTGSSCGHVARGVCVCVCVCVCVRACVRVCACTCVGV